MDYECQYKSANGRLLFKITGGNQKELFERIAELQEVFEADSACGCCGRMNIKFRIRKVNGKGAKANKVFTYYEMVCQECHARLAFGQNNDNPTLFPKRKDENGEYLPNRGWFKYRPKDEEEEAA